MKIHKHLILVILFLMGLAIQAKEVTFLTPKEMDLGEVESGRLIEDVIRFVNTGNEPVTVSRVNTSCGCTAVESNVKTYAPGDTASIPFKLNTRKFKGKVQKPITINFKNNDPPSESINLIVHCPSYLETYPGYISFSQISAKPDTLVKREVRITNHYKNPVKIKAIHTDIDILDVQFEKRTIQPGENYTFEVVLNPTYALKKSSRLMIETDNPNMEPIRMLVYVSILEQ